MLAIPLIELRGARCVTRPGADDEDADRTDDSLEVARRWVAAGFSRLQVTDIDAESGRSDNRDQIREILLVMRAAGGVAVQVGGGIRESEDILALLGDGADYVVVGARGVEDPGWLDEQATLSPGRLILAMELMDRRIASRGWAATPRRSVDDLMPELEDIPLAGLLVRALCKDGTQVVTDLALLEDLASVAPWPLIATGEFDSMQDLRNLEVRGVTSVILETSLHTAQLDPRVVAEEFGGA